MKTAIAIALTLLLAHSAFAQQLSPQQDAAVRLGQQIGLLTHENGELRAALAAAQAKIREIETKAPKPKQD